MASSVLYVFYLTHWCLHIKAPWILFCWLNLTNTSIVFTFFPLQFCHTNWILTWFIISNIQAVFKADWIATATDYEAYPATSQVAALCLERPGPPCVRVLWKRLWKPKGGILLCCRDVFPFFIVVANYLKNTTQNNVSVLICLECDKSLIVTVTRI